jgi:hypothetical protein
VSLSCLCPSVLSFCSVSLSCLCPSVLCPCRVCVLLFCPSVPSFCSVSLSCLCPSVLSFFFPSPSVLFQRPFFLILPLCSSQYQTDQFVPAVITY